VSDQPQMASVLHLHGQRAWHDEATIIGNGQALAALRDLIETALAEGNAKGEFFVADGEGYSLTVKLRPAPFGDPTWEEARLPYSDPIANPCSGEFDLQNACDSKTTD
jgi:hypothetical protein